MTVTGLPSGLSYTNGQVQGTVAADAAAQAYTVAVSADDGVNSAVEETFTITVTNPARARRTVNTPPVITDPGDKSYEQGKAITAFGITVTDADQDTVSVTVTGLPSGLSYTSDQVQGTVAVDAAIQDYTVTISADDGVNTAVEETFTITVTPHWNRPTVDISGPTTPQKGKFSVRIVFSEKVYGFTQSDVTVGNGSVTYFSGEYDTWSAEITPGVSGTVTVDVAANVAEDGAELGNVVAPQYSVKADFDAPAVGISGPTDTQDSAFDVTITFSESVTGFEKADVTVGNGAVTALSGSGSSYTATITPTASGTVTVDVAANKAVDAAGHGNTAASRFSVTAALTRPTVVITGPTNVQTGAFTLDIDFSEPVTGFEKADVTVGNGRVTGWAQTTAGDVRAIITPAASGTVTVDVAANVAVDGDNNGNLAATRFSVEAAMGEPTVTITCPIGVQTDRFTVDIDFSESVTGFEKADVTVGNGRVTGWAETNGDTLAIITPAASGTVTIDVPANVAVDSDGYGNFAARQCSVRADLSSAPAVTIADASAAEGDSITFTVTLDAAVSGGLTVTPSFTNGTAASTDYTANTAALTFTGTAGEKKTFTVATTEDEVVELDETFTVGLAVSGTSTTVSSGDTATGTITNDDTATLTVTDVRRTEGDDVPLTVTLDKAVQGGVSAYAVPHSGNASRGEDYLVVPVAFHFVGNAGEVRSCADCVSAVDDDIVEGTETFEIHLQPFPGKTPDDVILAGPATGTIIDNDSATVTIADASAVEGDSITFTATVDKAVVDGFTVTPSFTDVTATKGTDYTENTTALSFAGNAGETQTFTVATTDDIDDESNETFTVSLSLSGTSLAVTATDTATGVILEDDGATAVTVFDSSASEGNPLTFTVALNKAVSGGFTVTPSFTDVTATKGTDYTANTAALTFTGTAGEMKTFTVATTEDEGVEADETFTVSLSVSGTSETVAVTDTATGTILDNDASAVTIDDALAAEGDQITFTVTLDKAVTGGFTVTPSFTAGTAVSTDYTENTAGISFAGTAGEQKTFTVATAEDEVVEYDETFTVSLAVSGTTETVTATDTATGTITNDDFATVTIDDVTVAEIDATVRPVFFNARVDKRVQGGFVLKTVITDGTATSGSDFTNIPAGFTFNGHPAQPLSFVVSLNPIDDEIVEGTETFTIGFEVSNAPPGVTATDTATGTITDNDGAAVTIADASAREGNAITFTATVDKAVVDGFTVTPSFTNGTAAKGTDYTENTAALTFAGNAGEQQTFTVATTEDEEDTSNKTFTVNLGVSGTSLWVTATDTATGTILDAAAPDPSDPEKSNSPPVIGHLDGIRAFQYQTITPWTVPVSDPDGDEVTVTLENLPPGLSYTDGAVRGTVMPDEPRIPANEGRVWYVTVKADDGVAAPVTKLFKYNVLWAYPEITAPGNKTYEQGETIAAFAIQVSDPASTVTVTGLPTGLSYASGQVQGTVAADAEVKDYTVTITATGTGWPDATKTFTITVTSPAPPAVTIEDASASEGDQITFTVTLNQAVSGGLTVTPSFTDGTATEGTDYTENTTGISFAGTAGEQKTFTVATTEDTDEEEDETFTVGLTVSGAAVTVTATDTATGTITNDDGALLPVQGKVFSFSYQDVEEGSPLVVTVTQIVDGAYQVRYWTSAAQAETCCPAATWGLNPELGHPKGWGDVEPIHAPAWTGSDQWAPPGAFANFSKKGDVRTISIRTYEDDDVEHDEVFRAHFGAYLGRTVISRNEGVITPKILNDDQATITVSDATASEGGDLVFTVTLNKALPSSVTLTPSYTNGTATADDYTANTNKLTFTGQKGEQKTFTVSTTQDANLDESKTFTLGFTVPSSTPPWNYTGTGDAIAVVSGTGTILDIGTLPAVTIEDVSAAEGDSMTFTVTLDMAVSDGLTVTPSFTNGTAASTDYTANTSALTFAGTAGETKTFTVATTQDEVVELDETFTIGLTVSGTSENVTATDTATGTITNDDTATVTVGAVSGAEGGTGGGSFVVNGKLYTEVAATATLDKAVQGGFQLYLAASAGTATMGSNYSTTDFGASLVSLHFAGNAGERQSLDRNWVAIHQDEVVEGTETFGISYRLGPLPGEGPVLPPVPDGVAVDGPTTGTIHDDDSATVTIADASAVEGDAITFTAAVDKAVVDGFTVTPSFTDGTAAKGTDYTENTAGISFAGNAGETQTFTVATTGDADEETNETFTVSLSLSGTSLAVTATDTAEGTIIDEDGATTVTVNDASAVEGGSMTFTVTLNQAVSGGLTVTPSFTDGTATKGTDYTENTAALTFSGNAGETQTFTVATAEDADKEADETFIVGLSVTGTAETVTSTDTATGTILDDDGAAVLIGNARAQEGDRITFTVVLTKAVSGGLTVTPSFTDGTTTKGTDYTENTNSLTFTGNAGETQTFTVATTEDADMEADETFTVGLSVTGTAETVTSTDTATGTILDDDAAALTIADASAAEGDSLTFTVTLDKAVSGGLTVTPGFTDGTTTKGTDYTENTAALSFAGTAGETKTFTVATTEDADMEADETFTVSLSVSSTLARVTSTDTATGTILDDDAAALTIADASADEGGSITFTVTLDKAVSGGLTVTPSFTDVTATKGTDYTENTAALSFTGTADETKTFTVMTTEDADAEPDETFTVGLSVSGTQAPVRATDTATGTITNDDGALAYVTIADASAAEGDSLTFTVTLDAAVPGGLTVTPSFTDVTATKGTDYTENTAALTFAGTAGETKSFTVTTTEDADAEPDETFGVSLAVSGTQALVAATDRATGTITNDDGALPAVTIADASADEGEGITFTVTLDKAVSGGLTVEPDFTDVTATKGTDYTENTAALTFAGTAGETKSFTVTTTEDADAEPDETFTVGLTASGTTATVTATDKATGTITNDDGALPGTPVITNPGDKTYEQGETITEFDITVSDEATDTLTVTVTGLPSGLSYTNGQVQGTVAESAAVQDYTVTIRAVDEDNLSAMATFTITVTEAAPAVTIEDASASEGDQITFTVTLDAAVSGGLTVTPSFTDGTATKGTDYTENTSALSFAGTAGEQKTFTVTTTEDTDSEADETFTVSLAVSGTTATVTATDTATGTILDDEAPAVTIEDASASEGDQITFTVTLDKAVSGQFYVGLNFTDGTATAGTDYTKYQESLSFAGTAGEQKTFTVETIEDTTAELDETFTVSLSVQTQTQKAAVTATDTATGTINNDDGALAALTIADESADEGDQITFTVTLDNAVTGGLKVTPSFTDVTATKGTDYTENTAALTFAGTAGETQTFTVATTEDTDKEHHETFTVGLTVSGTTAEVTATDTATGTINNDDGSLAAVTIEDASAAEGDQITFTVTLDNAVNGGLTVTPSFTDVTATKGTDYTENTAALTFAGTAGETQTFTVATTEDTDKEHHETFTVGLTVSGTTAEVTASDTATGTITNDDGALAAVTIGDISAAEGDSLTFTVTLDEAVSGGLKVTPSFTDVTATEGTDYTENTTALTFAGTAGEHKAKTFTVATTEDVPLGRRGG